MCYARAADFLRTFAYSVLHSLRAFALIAGAEGASLRFPPAFSARVFRPRFPPAFSVRGAARPAQLELIQNLSDSRTERRDDWSHLCPLVCNICNGYDSVNERKDDSSRLGPT